MRVLLSGGGTGGHVYPAIAIANKIKEEKQEKMTSWPLTWDMIRENTIINNIELIKFYH